MYTLYMYTSYEHTLYVHVLDTDDTYRVKICVYIYIYRCYMHTLYIYAHYIDRITLCIHIACPHTLYTCALHTHYIIYTTGIISYILQTLYTLYT